MHFSETRLAVLRVCKLFGSIGLVFGRLFFGFLRIVFWRIVFFPVVLFHWLLCPAGWFFSIGHRPLHRQSRYVVELAAV